VSGQRTSKARAKFDADALPVLESLDVRVAFDWLRAGQITLDVAGLPKFPQGFNDVKELRERK
jgi:hypothetical protein